MNSLPVSYPVGFTTERAKQNKTKLNKQPPPKKPLKRISLISEGYICESSFTINTNVDRKARLIMYTSSYVTHLSKAERGYTHTHSY